MSWSSDFLPDTVEDILKQMQAQAMSGFRGHVWKFDKDAPMPRQLLFNGNGVVRGSVEFEDTECYDPFKWEVDLPSESRINGEPLCGRMPSLRSARDTVDSILICTLADRRASPTWKPKQIKTRTRPQNITPLIQTIQNLQLPTLQSTGVKKVNLYGVKEDIVGLIHLLMSKVNGELVFTLNHSWAELAYELMREYYGVTPDGDLNLEEKDSHHWSVEFDTATFSINPVEERKVIRRINYLFNFTSDRYYTFSPNNMMTQITGNQAATLSHGGLLWQPHPVQTVNNIPNAATFTIGAVNTTMTNGGMTMDGLTNALAAVAAAAPPNDIF